MLSLSILFDVPNLEILQLTINQDVLPHLWYIIMKLWYGMSMCKVAFSLWLGINQSVYIVIDRFMSLENRNFTEQVLGNAQI